MTTNFKRTADWLALAGKEPGNLQHFSVQLGNHIEEIVEMFDCIAVVANSVEAQRNQLHAQMSREHLKRVLDSLDAVAGDLKSGRVSAYVLDPVGLLDSLGDQSVTGDGVAFLAGFDKDGADTAIIDSNYDKFVDGKPLFKEGGKIAKREGWVAPDLTPFVADFSESLAGGASDIGTSE